MRAFIFSITLILFFISTWFYICKNVDVLYADCYEHLNSIESSIELDDWPLAESSINELKNYIEKRSTFFGKLLIHNSIESIYASAITLETCIKHKSKIHAFIEISSLKNQLDSIKDDQKLNLYNIF